MRCKYLLGPSTARLIDAPFGMTLAIVFAITVAGCSNSQSTDSAFATLFPTGPIACPEDSNDLAGIEGWAPGAGKAEQTGQTNMQNFGAFGGALGGASAPAPSPTASACTGLRSDVVARFATIQTNIALVPTDGWDPSARASELNDMNAAFAFVRDKIQTEAYPGAMRGASGTLQSHGGSPADKALLLAALLSAKNIPVRFVHSTLSASDVAMVENGIATSAMALTASPNAAAQQSGTNEQQIDTIFQKIGIDPQTARANAAAYRQRAQSAVDGVIATSRSASDDILKAFGSGGVSIATNAASLRMVWASNLSDHWWVQAQDNGQWVDLDPTLTNAQPGSHLGATPADAPSDQLPDAVKATFTVTILSGSIANGSLVTSTLVSNSASLPENYATPINVTIGDRSAGTDKIAQSTSFTPSITIGSNGQDGSAFDPSSVAFVRLNIEVKQPGNAPREYTRLIVDRRSADGKALDPAWTPARTAYALTISGTILPVAGEFDPGFAGIQEADGMKNLQAFMAYAAAGGNGKQMPPPGAETYPLQAMHYFEYDALGRMRLEDARAGHLRFFFDRPQIAIQWHGFSQSNSGIDGFTKFDIVENGMSAVGAANADDTAAIRDNVTRGYLDTYAEQHLFSAPNDGGTIALFEDAKKAGVTPQIVRDANAEMLAVNTPRAGWWEFDPQSGNLIGRMGPSGAGQELAEYAIARANDWSTLYAMIQFYGDFFRCIAGAVEAPLEGMGGAQAQSWFKQCAGAAVCSYLEALGSGEAFSRWGTDAEALLYNIMDLSVPGSKDSWPPTGGAACSGMFSSPLYPPS